MKALLRLEGSGDPSPARARQLAITESVLVGGRDVLKLGGNGTHAFVQQSVLVAGQDAVSFEPGAGHPGHLEVELTLEHVTVAGRRGVLGLEDTAGNGPVLEPALVVTRHCAYLNPFAAPGNRAGLLAYSGDALARGLVVWQGEGDLLDKALRFGAEPASTPGADNPNWPMAWSRLWGPLGLRKPYLEVTTLRKFEAKMWPLDRLQLPARDLPPPSSGKPIPGADLKLVGILKK